ncbi:helix-turn-helix domain-containing protein [Modestobacter muralis]|uniref:Helix-turn-helix domain-containing protein n=1 Tax=Modestobacter muralis TaxID=1608614 RepID=A0A6P0HA59_9ACTN|nr:helix-turn-helix domain-containing protein [Modestobacter muralis]NEK94146.1 helix-turn-helix domain-containing protein [Modestobacter muralis]NEN50914.1 helix-turn-helix domain-containing protein [Modestobacter muralis]
MTNSSSTSAPQPDRLLTTEDVALILVMSPGTLRNWRTAGRGPRALKVGAQVRYRRADVDAWIAAQTEADPVDQRRQRAAEIGSRPMPRKRVQR